MSGRAVCAKGCIVGLTSAAVVGLVCGCEPWQIALGGSGGVVGSTVVGGSSPGQEIEQVY